MRNVRADFLKKLLVFFAVLALSPAAFSHAQERVGTSVEMPDAPATLRVKAVQIGGNTRIGEAELRPFVAPYEGREVLLTELEKGAGLIQSYYRDRGYLLAQAYLPSQVIDVGGVVRVEIMEGRIGEIRVEGNRSYSAPFIANRLRVGLPGGIFRQGPFQKSLLLLNELSDLKVEPVLQPGQEKGTADLVVKVKDRFPAHVGLEYDDFGSRNIGKHRVRLLGSLGNLAANGDVLSTNLVFASSPAEGDHPFYQLGYTLPINRRGTQIALSYSNSIFRVGGEFEALDIRGEGEAWGLSVTHPVYRTPTGGADLLVGMTGKSSENEILGFRANHDALRLLNVGYRMNRATSPTSRYLFSANVVRGIGENWGGMDDDSPLASRPGGDNSFTKATIDVDWLKQLSPRFFVLLRGGGQIASQTVVAMEQYAVGGPDTVRGFPQSEVFGDSGYRVSAELKATLFEGRKNLWQAVAFVDHGGASLKDPPTGQDAHESLSGGGIGFRLSLGQWGLARFDLGFPMDPSKNSEDKSPILYSQVAIHF